MLRRSFLSGLASLPLLGFLKPTTAEVVLEGKKEKVIDHPLGLKNIKALRKSQYNRFDQLFEQSYRIEMHQYLSFPLETEVIIEYENGEETYLCYNMDIKDYSELSLDTFLSCNAIATGKIGDDRFSYEVCYRNNKLRLSSIQVWDCATESKSLYVYN